MKATLSRLNFVNLIFSKLLFTWLMSPCCECQMAHGVTGLEKKTNTSSISLAVVRLEHGVMSISCWYRWAYAIPSWNHFVFFSVAEVQNDLKQNQIRMISTTMKIPNGNTIYVTMFVTHSHHAFSPGWLHIPRQVVKLSVLNLKSIEPVQERNQSLLKWFLWW